MVTDYHQEELWPSDRNVQSPLVQQEPETLLDIGLEIAPDAVEDDDVLFAALEGVDSVDLDRVMDVAALV